MKQISLKDSRVADKLLCGMVNSISNIRKSSLMLIILLKHAMAPTLHDSCTKTEKTR